LGKLSSSLLGLEGISGAVAETEMVLYVLRFVGDESGAQPVFFYPDL
jgi:hypothetical protein